MGRVVSLPVSPAAPTRAGVDIAAQWREEVKARDWGRVHLEGDRNPPLSFLSPRRWRYSQPSPETRPAQGGAAGRDATSPPPVRAAGSDNSGGR